MTRCPNCGQETPEGEFCVRCGWALSGQAAVGRRFPAAPDQHLSAPDPISSLYPQLPRADMRDYRWALAIGAVVVVVLGIAGLFPVALIAAAVLVPLLTAIYFLDVDIYEQQPALVVGFTLIWGGLAGVGVALLAAQISPGGLTIAQAREASAPAAVLGLPLLTIALAIAGPALVLLPYKRFNDMLDGAAFGAASGAALAGAEVCVYGLGVLDAGLRPGGEVLPWVGRLASIGVLLPVLTMAAAGAATATLWLRYRSPAGEARRLGPLGNPLLTLPLAGALLVAAAAGQRWLSLGLWLIVLLALDGAALLWLRRTLSAGLLEEAAEREIGPPVRCSNCGSQTPRHTFCSTCGVALRALPKGGDEGGGPGDSRLGRWRRLLSLGAAFAVAVGAVAVAVAVAAPPAAKPPCPPGPTQCGTPPSLPLPILGETRWRSSALGLSLAYPANQWSLETQDDSGIRLASTNGPLQLEIDGERSGSSAQQLVDGRLSELRDRVLGLTEDTSAASVILDPSIGYRPGAGAGYVGAVDTPQGVKEQVFVTVLAATDGRVGVVATTVTDETDPNQRLQLYQLADVVTNNVKWEGSP